MDPKIPTPTPNVDPNNAPGFNPGQVNTASATGMPQDAGAKDVSAANPSGPVSFNKDAINFEILGIAVQLVPFIMGVLSGSTEIPRFSLYIRGHKYNLGPIPVKRV